MRSFATKLSSLFLLAVSVTVIQPTVSLVNAAGPDTTKVALGESHAVAVSTNGTVWTWGSLMPGPRGVGSRYSLNMPTRVSMPGDREIINVAATRYSSVALASDGSVWAWGNLGIGLGDSAATTSTDYMNPVQVSFGSNKIAKVTGDCEGYIAIDSNGDVWQWGSFWGVWSLSKSVPTQVAGVSNAVAVAKSCSSAYAVLEDGTVKAWGSNGGGKLGDGSTSDRESPVSISISGKRVSSLAVSDSHVLALASDGTLWGWGSNNYSQLALDPATVQYSTSPRRILVTGATGSVVGIAATGNTPSSFAIMSSGEVWEWGSWSPTQFLPRQRNLPTNELGSVKLVSVSAYYNNMLFVGSDNSIWGRGQYGTYGTTVDGNCGADAYDYPQWINGRSVPARFLVRAISSGQFGPSYVEDRLTIRGLTTSSGTLLPLDGSGTAVGRQGNSLSVIAAAPTSACFISSQLTVTWDFDGDGIFETAGVTSTNEEETPINTGTYSFDWSGRRRGSVKIVNPDGVSQNFSFWLGVTAASSGSGGGNVVTALPIAETSDQTTLALGTDGHIYGWGEQTAVLGLSTVLPRRLLPDVNTAFTKLKFQRYQKVVGYSVAGVMTSTGVVSIWGLSKRSGLFFDGNGSRRDSSPSLFQIPLPTGVARWLDFTLEICGYGNEVFVKLIGDDQQLYVHGVGSAMCTSSNSAIPRAVTVAAGFSFSEFGPGALLKATDGWKYWTLRNIGSPSMNSCEYYSLSTCQSSPIEHWSPVTAKVAGTSFGQDSSYCTRGYGLNSFEINSVGQIEKVTRRYTGGNTCSSYPNSRGTLEVVSRTNISNWTTRTASEIGGSTNRWGYTEIEIIASDGTVWLVDQWSKSPLRQVFLDNRMPVAKRFAGDSKYIVTDDSALWIAPTDEYYGKRGKNLGSCATAWSNEDGAGVRVFSSGQFGAAIAEDRFGFQIDAPSLIANEQFPNHGYQSRQNDFGGNPSVYLRPNNAGQLYGYVTSSCDGSNITKVEWDMNDDDTYETNGVIASVMPGATPMSTTRVNLYGETTYPGFTSAWKQVLTPVMDLSVPGGRYVGLKITSAYGEQTKRFTILVQPKKPAGYVGVTINSTARFTDSTDVELTLNWPEGASTALISNDGGFADAQEVPLARTVRWKLSSIGSGQLGTTVYVRYYNLIPDGSGSWAKEEVGYQVADDIVLDLSAPIVSNVSATAGSGLAAAQRADGFVFSVSGAQHATVTVAALDMASGIAGMQVASDPAVPGPILPYSSQVRVEVDRARVAVRVQDNVGLWSDWIYARVAGFVTQPEVPSVEPEVPTVIPVVPQVPAVVPEEKKISPEPQPASQVAAVPKVVKATAVLKGTSASVAVSVPASLAKTCTTKVVKGKKVSSCKAAAIVVSVSGGATKTYSAKSGSNAFKLPAKKGATVTIKVGGKIIKKIKL